MATQSDPQTNDVRARVHALLLRHGWNATSFQTLASKFQYRFFGEEACVSFVDTGSAWVAAGAPIAPQARLVEVARMFVEAANTEGRRACFFGTEPRFAVNAAFRLIHIGEQPTWDPTKWSAILSLSRSLREQLRRARAKNVQVKELRLEQFEQARTDGQLDSLVRRWLDSRSMPPMRFLVDLELFSFADRKRCWVAEYRGETVGFLLAVPVYERQGWFFENILRDQSAPNGTTELLIDAAMCAVADEGCTYVTLGLVPLSGPIGTPLRWARRAGRGFYDFEGLRRFKSKLRPTGWTPIFLSVPAAQRSWLAIYDILSAFAGTSLTRFAWRAFMTKPRVLASALAVSLVPWTATLGLASPDLWFPSRAIWSSWIVFDVMLTSLLFWLAHRWRRWLAVCLATCITADAMLTSFEALLFNLPRAKVAPATGIVVAIAMLGPTLAAVLLWRAIDKTSSDLRS